MKELTVIIPAYNVEKYIASTLDCLVAQDFYGYEAVVIDDGSQDVTNEMLSEYALQDERFLIVSKKNSGVSASRNVGLSVATGDSICFIDSDDELKKSHLSSLLKGKCYDFVTAGFYQEKKDYTWIEKNFIEDHVLIKNIRQNPIQYLGKNYFNSPWSKLYKRQIIEKYGIEFDTSVRRGEDTLFVFNYLEYCSNMCILEQSGYMYKYRSGSLVHSNHAGSWLWKIMMDEAIAHFFSPHNKENEEYLDNQYFLSIKEILNNSNNIADIRERMQVIVSTPLYINVLTKIPNQGNIIEKTFVFSIIRQNVSLYSLARCATKIIGKLKRR